MLERTQMRIRQTAVLSLLALAAVISAFCAPAGAASVVSPLPASDYSVAALCRPPSFGSAGCLGLRLVAKAPLAVRGARALFKAGRNASGSSSPAIEFKKPFAGSLTPSNLRTAYNLSGTPPPVSTQTIALVDAYDDPNAAADLETYDKEFGLPACTEKDGCFHKVNQEGKEAPLPPSSSEGKEPEAGWALEISTDIEVAHGVCQSCHILLVEAGSAEYIDLEAGEETAVRLGATEISNSWGGPEIGEDSKAFNHAGIVITAAAGDEGYLDWSAEKAEERGLPDYPASSPHVIAVGGTHLTLGAGGTWAGETVWNDGGQNNKGEREGAGAGGGGCSASFIAPSWQLSVSDWASVGCGEHRAVADVSADADPYTGVAVYDSTPVLEESEEVKGWNVLGGTSVASPIVASVFGLAGGAGGVAYPARTLYENEVKAPGSLHDVISGSNGECLKPFHGETGISGCTSEEEANSCSAKPAICRAGIGYDGPTGVGTPKGIAAFEPGGGEEGKKTTEEEKKAEEKKKNEEREEEERSKGSGGGSKEGGGSGGQSTAGASTSTPTGNTTIQLSGLALTLNAIIALNRTRPAVSQVGFTFILSAATRVRATLARQVRVHGHTRWAIMQGSLTIAAVRGRNRRHLRSRHTLAPGRYRLTLTPLHGTARSLVFQIR
jgi:hypothetical protein